MPYLAQVDPITPDLANELDYLSDINTEMQSANWMLSQIRNELVLANGGMIPKNQEANIITPKSSAFAGDTLNTVRSANAEADAAQHAELKAMREEMEKMRIQLAAALASLEAATVDSNRQGSNTVANAFGDLARTGVIARMG